MRKLTPLFAMMLLIAACQSGDHAVKPPVAKKIPHEIVTHGHKRVDPYYWMNQRENPEVVAYLEAENVYLKAVMKDTEPLQEKLYHEIRSRIKEMDNKGIIKFYDFDSDYFIAEILHPSGSRQ